MVSTAFWSDNYAANLDPIEKLLFLYLLTNERSTLAGIYELPLKVMAVETGIEIEMVKKILARFEDELKVKYEGGWVAIKNFLKHHEHGSPLVQKGISDAIKSSPEWAKQFVGKGINTLSPSASASASALSSNTGGAKPPQTLEVIVGNENTDTEREPKSKPKYPNARILFKEVWGANYPRNWNTNITILQSGENLFAERGIKECKDAIEWYEDMQRKFGDDPYFPTVATPYDLDTKWGKLEAFDKKHK